MLREFWEFDRKMIHEKYKLPVEGLEPKIASPNPAACCSEAEIPLSGAAGSFNENES